MHYIHAVLLIDLGKLFLALGSGIFIWMTFLSKFVISLFDFLGICVFGDTQ
jgi:maltodextrin utilization protein YvdJ